MIITPDRRVRVFLSSTLDLTAERAAARAAVESLQLTPVMFEAGARPHPPRTLYRAYVDQSDVFVAIYSTRYGWTAPGMDVSGLEDEFNVSAGKPRLVYIQTGVEREPALDAFLERLSDAGLSYKPFASVADLEPLLRSDLVALLTERFHTAATTTDPGSMAPSALPVPATALVGRDADVRAVVDLVGRADVRLVTLLGAGGIGKTRLAIAAAQHLDDAFPDGVFFVPLATVAAPERVSDAIATALGVTAGELHPRAAVATALQQRRVLLVLDNFEHLVAVAGTVAELLEATRQLKVLVTSRAPLRIRGEHEVDVAPLALPGVDVGSDDLDSYASVRLFVTAAQAVRADFCLDETTGATVAEICRQLDGLPLAIELAAAQIRLLSPDQLLDRLRDRITDLASGLRDVPGRHQTLRATIAWSYDLLDDRTKELLAQLGAFHGGFTLERAEQICVTDGDLFAAVGTLVEQSLLRVEVGIDAAPRFTMLGTIHRFARERLHRSPHRDTVLARHAQLFTNLAATVGGPGGRSRQVLDTVEAELDNIRRAFDWYLARGEPGQVASAVGESWWFWWIRGHVREAKQWADHCLDADDLDVHARARALVARAMLAIWSGEYALAVSAFEAAIVAGQQAGDARSVAYADIGLGLVRGLTGPVHDGLELIRRGIDELVALGDDAGATSGLVAAAWTQAITRHFDDDELLRQALDEARTHGSDLDIGISESAMAQLHLTRGELDEAVALLADALDHLASARHIGSTILTLEVIAEIAIAAGASVDAATLLGATAATRDAMGTQVPPAAEHRLGQLLAIARDHLGADFPVAYDAGSHMGFGDAVALGGALLLRLSPTAAISRTPT